MTDPFDTKTLDGGPARAKTATRSFLFLVMAGHDGKISPSRHDLSLVDRVTFGRGPTTGATRSEASGISELRVSVADGAMSGDHAVLERTTAGWAIQDRNSKNGVYVDGERTTVGELKFGQLLELGRTFFLVSQHNCAAATKDRVGPALNELGLGTLLPPLENEFNRLLEVARSAVTVLITGETGTGKELAARALHKASARKGACVAVNCGALPSNLVESELFGYRKGAFSGANEDRPGLIRSAHHGTLFLDEIGELPLQAQVALLRALEQRAVVPVGGTAEIPADFRLCSATHRDLEQSVRAQTFRADLLGRLSGYSLRLPALRHRREDFGVVVAALLRRFQPYANDVSFTNEACRALLTYRWPQNIRELAKALETAIVLAKGEPVDIDHLPESIRGDAGDSDPGDAPAQDEAALREKLVALLTEHRGNLSAVARALDKDRVQIRRWMRRMGIELARFRGPES